MAWETRGSRRFYYRSHKVDGRIVRDYVGAGPVADRALVDPFHDTQAVVGYRFSPGFAEAVGVSLRTRSLP
jgi:hypothetical protein